MKEIECSQVSNREIDTLKFNIINENTVDETRMNFDFNSMVGDAKNIGLDEKGIEKYSHITKDKTEEFNNFCFDLLYESYRNNKEEIRFLNILNNKPVLIKDIDDVIFSEIMRDFDLAVSVAYLGEENKELGLSSVDIRKSILEVNTKLFKLENLVMDKHKVKIKGTHGNYVVSLKSGDVHKEGSGQLELFPMNVRKNKDVYLHYIDKNGKTQEIMAIPW